jgi:hypothetical protein
LEECLSQLRGNLGKAKVNSEKKHDEIQINEKKRLEHRE